MRGLSLFTIPWLEFTTCVLEQILATGTRRAGRLPIAQDTSILSAARSKQAMPDRGSLLRWVVKRDPFRAVRRCQVPHNGDCRRAAICGPGGLGHDHCGPERRPIIYEANRIAPIQLR